MFSASEMRVFCRVMFLALRELNASSRDQLMEQWSMIEWSLPASPPPSMVWPLMLPGRLRMKRTTASRAPLMPRAQLRRQMPLPGAVWPAMVT